MPDETNVADPGVKVRAPQDYCFEIDILPARNPFRRSVALAA